MLQWLLLLWISVASAELDTTIGEPPMLDSSEIVDVEGRSYALAKILRCPVCQGLSVADSRSDAAVAMKDRIRELVEMGYSDEQIIDYFVGRYGEFTLLKPKYEHWFVWIAPIVLAILGVGIVVARVRSQASTTVDPEETKSASPNDASKYRQQILAELEEE